MDMIFDNIPRFVYIKGREGYTAERPTDEEIDDYYICKLQFVSDNIVGYAYEDFLCPVFKRTDTGLGELLCDYEFTFVMCVVAEIENGANIQLIDGKTENIEETVIEFCENWDIPCNV